MQLRKFRGPTCIATPLCPWSDAKPQSACQRGSQNVAWRVTVQAHFPFVYLALEICPGSPLFPDRIRNVLSDIALSNSGEWRNSLHRCGPHDQNEHVGRTSDQR